ncbi:MAG: ATP-binding protein [Leptospirales bacterium]|nr:ATP-binding protein [Leptospirales bacterium]
MIDRPEYLAELERHKGKSDLIKVVTGVRRCGKSTLLKLFQERLKKNKVPKRRIIDINLEDIENEDLRAGRTLYKHVKDRATGGDLHYVFIDEIQLASDYEDAANGLRLLKNVDLYVTGSNSNILSGEFAARWAGRYVEIKMLPLSFKEYSSIFFNVSVNPDLVFKDYVELSSFPEVWAYYSPSWMDGSFFLDGTKMMDGGKWDKLGVRDYLNDTIYNSIIIKDVIRQHGIKEAALLERVVKCLFSNIGSETSINSMVNMLNNDLRLSSKDKKVYASTLEVYIDGLIKSFVFYKAERYYVKGRAYLRTNAKYYAVDVGLRYLLLGNKGTDSGHVLENIVYLELLRRGYKVYVGKVGEKEIDFIAEGADGIEYYQVAETVRGKETLARELASLNAIRDHNPKFLLTRDYDPAVSYNGIKQLNVLDWLLK